MTNGRSGHRRECDHCLSEPYAHHGAAIVALGRKRTADLVLPATSYAVILVGPHRRGKATVSKVEAFVSDFGMQVESIDTDIARRAAILRSRRKGLKLPDALVPATGDILGASAVLTADTSWPKISSAQTASDPFETTFQARATRRFQGTPHPPNGHSQFL